MLPRCKESRSLTHVALLAATALMGMAGTAGAGDFYLGIGAGSSRLLDADHALVGSAFDDKDGATKVYAGYRYNRHLSVELGYADLGEFTGSVFGVTTQRSEVSAFNLSLVGTLPLPHHLALLGKIGVASWDVGATTLGIGAEESGSSLSSGAGFQYDFTRRFSARLEWEQFSDVGEQDVTGESDIGVFTASVSYRF